MPWVLSCCLVLKEGSERFSNGPFRESTPISISPFLVYPLEVVGNMVWKTPEGRGRMRTGGWCVCTLGKGEAVGWGHRTLELDQIHLPHAKRSMGDALAVALGRCLLRLHAPQVRGRLDQLWFWDWELPRSAGHRRKNYQTLLGEAIQL